MIRKITRTGAAAAVVLATLLVPTQVASAADGCGAGWYKESDGYLTKQTSWQGEGNHNGSIFHSGRVRFCTENDTFVDDVNRKAIIGYPGDTYSFESQVTKNGNYTSFCVRQTLKVRMSGIEASQSWNITGEFSKSDPGVSFSYSSTTETLTVTAAKTAHCGADANQVFSRIREATVIADNDSGRIEWVSLTTNLTAKYSINGNQYVENVSLAENDYS